jgi:hypothetical protein
MYTGKSLRNNIWRTPASGFSNGRHQNPINPMFQGSRRRGR